MFIWLASYPKSGNTLVRSLLCSYFFSTEGKLNFDSWKSFKYQQRYLLIRYENLFNDKEKIFLSILRFICK